MPSMPTFSISTYIQLTLGAILLALGFYCNVLMDRNDSLTQKNTELTSSYNAKVEALTTCSKATTELKAKEIKLTADALIAVAEAKKKAVLDYKASNDFLFRKPKPPVITPENVINYGGAETSIQLGDYLSTQELMNEFIDGLDKK